MIRGIPDFLINVKSLAIHNNHNLHFPDIFKKITETRRKTLIRPVVHGDPHLIQTDKGMGFRLEIGKSAYRNDPDSWYLHIGHIRINIPSLTQITMHLPDHITRLSRTLFPKNKYELIRIAISSIQKGKTKRNNKKNKTGSHHNI